MVLYGDIPTSSGVSILSIFQSWVPGQADVLKTRGAPLFVVNLLASGFDAFRNVLRKRICYGLKMPRLDL